MPDGREFDNGGDLVLSKEDLANAGVVEWIESGWILDAKKAPIAKPSVDTAALEADNAALATVNADLAAKLAALQADLEAATAPKA